MPDFTGPEVTEVAGNVEDDLSSAATDQYLHIRGARVHNLRNIELDIPRYKFVVITGLSGSGKSSLAFDTIYAEGQRRYIETFSAYARQFLGTFERPDVDYIEGLSPVVAIEQKSTGRNPRSTVGTITEVYDFLRLLFARVADAWSYNTGERMVKYTPGQILDIILSEFNSHEIIILAPLVRARKGHYRELFQQLLKKGFLRVRVDGEIREMTYRMQLDRYKTHDVELVIDQLTVSGKTAKRLASSLETALKHSKGSVMIAVQKDDVVQLRYFSRNFMCPTTGISYPDPEPNSFSFNSPYGACPICHGTGTATEIDIRRIIPDPALTIRHGGIAPLVKISDTLVTRQIEALGDKYGFTLDTPVGQIREDGMNAILYGTDELLRVKNISIDRGTRVISNEYHLTFDGIVNILLRQHGELPSVSITEWVESFMQRTCCKECKGARLRKESLYFRFFGKNIAELSSMDISDLLLWLENSERQLSSKEKLIATDLLKEITKRLNFLINVGLDYLSLDRTADSLSGGESQRIRLATQVGTQLTDVLYILDEPSIGLHQRDNTRLIAAMKQLRDGGNTVIVVEHDKQMILSADFIVDLGPFAGVHGGRVVATGCPDDVVKSNSLTAEYLSGKKMIRVPLQRRKGNGKSLTIRNAAGNNLKDISVSFPLGTFIGVTGVSGSGKSSLINETLFPVIYNLINRSNLPSLPYQDITGIEELDKVIEVDQSPIGRSPRSNPATYTGLFTDIRMLFSQLPEARIRGYKPGRFSFNVKGGRCEECGGAGIKVIQMNYLPDVYIHCDGCNGMRYNRETLEVRYKGKSIKEVLDLPIEAAVSFFEGIPAIRHRLKAMLDVGLGYVFLGQPSTTLSGGEAQRIKLATELARRSTGKTLYILDEPTTGLHFEDVKMLLEVLQKLVDKGNTVLVIEHNLEVIKCADYIIDLGPEGGKRGGELIVCGTPEEVMRCGRSYTGQYLKKEL